MLKQTDAAFLVTAGYRYDRRLSGKGAGGTSAWRAHGRDPQTGGVGTGLCGPA
ncbi:MAG: hypothetical protein ACLTSZ_17200 [Lachnospiraceae bacterium]